LAGEGRPLVELRRVQRFERGDMFAVMVGDEDDVGVGEKAGGRPGGQV
jgi:hypothetical protein